MVRVFLFPGSSFKTVMGPRGLGRMLCFLAVCYWKRLMPTGCCRQTQAVRRKGRCLPGVPQQHLFGGVGLRGGEGDRREAQPTALPEPSCSAPHRSWARPREAEEGWLVSSWQSRGAEEEPGEAAAAAMRGHKGPC